jgi:ribosomal protein S27E
MSEYGRERPDPNACRDCGRDLRIRSHASDCPRLVVRCEHCGQRVPQGQTSQVDISLEDEYYPEFIHLCGGCSDSSSTGKQHGGADE